MTNQEANEFQQRADEEVYLGHGDKIDADILAALNPNRKAEDEGLPDMALDKPYEAYFEGLFPKGQVHLFGGPSGAGKTTLAFEMYKALTHPEDGEWLGRKTIPAAWAYVSGDRASNSVYMTQKRVGVNFKVFSLVDHGIVGADLTSEVFPRLTKFYGYRPNFIYIDGFTSMCPQGELNKYKPVAVWLANLQMYCQRKNMTIVGACHTTKVKEGEMFTEPRQRIAGTVAWAAYSESVVIVEPSSKTDPSKRSVLLLPRNSPEDKLHMEFNQMGRLVLAEGTKDAASADRFVLDTMYKAMSLSAGEEVLYLRLWNEAQKKHIGRRTFDRWLAKQVEDKKLARAKKGLYSVC